MAAKHRVGFARDLRANGVFFPRGRGEELLQLLLVGIRDGFFHALHVAFFGLKQAMEVTCGSFCTISCNRLE